MAENTEVWVVDDDRAVRESLARLLTSTGYAVRTYDSATSVLQANDRQPHGCFVIDLNLPEMSGIALWRMLREQGCKNPAVLISGEGDIPSVVSAMRLGAVDFLEKPFSPERLVGCVRTGIQRQQVEYEHGKMVAQVELLVSKLTARERQVMGLVASGMLTKQIASKLGISEKTVEVHRSNLTKKMKVRSVAQLVRMITKYGPKFEDADKESALLPSGGAA